MLIVSALLIAASKIKMTSGEESARLAVWQRLSGDIQRLVNDTKGMTIEEYGSTYLKFRSGDSFDIVWKKIGGKMNTVIRKKYVLADEFTKHQIDLVALGGLWKIELVQPEKRMYMLIIDTND